MRFRPILLVTLAVAAPLAAPLFARTTQESPQDSVEEEAPPPTATPTDAASIARAAATRGDQAEALSQYLHVLSTSPNNIEALSGAGRAALAVGDVNAATGFFARAEEIAPTNGAVKAGLGSATVQTGNGRAALRYFKQAQALGVPEATIAEDRGLAYDLSGDSRRAQASYQLALVAKPGDPTTVRRLALSQAIAGNLPAALATLDPLLRKQDIPAWRTRAFAKALTGDVAGAEQDAGTVMPPNQVAVLRPYLVRLASMKPADKAAAVFLGRFPQPGGRTTVASAVPPKKQPAPKPTRGKKVPTGVIVADASVATAANPGAPAAEPAKTEAAPEPAVEDSPALRAQRQKVAAATRAETAAQKKKREAKEKAAEQAKVAKSNPPRHFVQVAGGANKADLPKAWAALKAKWPSQLAGRSPWTMHYRFTNRLLIGPFPTSAAAQEWVTQKKKEGLTTFRVSTKAGEEVEKL